MVLFIGVMEVIVGWLVVVVGRGSVVIRSGNTIVGMGIRRNGSVGGVVVGRMDGGCIIKDKLIKYYANLIGCVISEVNCGMNGNGSDGCGWRCVW